MNQPIVLLDMDGVLVDIEPVLLQFVRDHYPNALTRDPFAWKIEDRFYGVERDDLAPLFYAEKFFLNLPVMPGAYAGVEQLSKHADLWVCTTPKLSMHCASEKQTWIDKHFPELKRKVILTKDKTMIRGGYLIDDKPEITGVCVPSWEHVWYHHSAFVWSGVQDLCTILDSEVAQ